MLQILAKGVEYKDVLKKQVDDAFLNLLSKLDHLTGTSSKISSPFDQLREVVWLK